MGKWKKTGALDNAFYNQVVKDEFILTQGSLCLEFGDNPFRARPYFPSFQLLKVHKNHPIQVTDCGRITVHPAGDKRLIGEVLRDKNPNVYDSVSFFLAPYEIKLPEDYPGRAWTTFAEGFVNQDGSKRNASLVYIGKRGLEIDGQYIDTLSVIPPSQIPPHLENWLYNTGRVLGYDDKAPFGQGLKGLGRFELNDIGGTALVVAQELEKRFKTRVLTERH